MPVTSNICAVCSITAKQRCAGCFNVFYCSRDHQKQHWKIHKSLCRPIKVFILFYILFIKLVNLM